VSRHNLRVAYDPTTGFFGTEVKGDRYQLAVSEYDKILLISRDGSYRIIGPEDKVLVPDKVIHCQVFDPEQGAAFTVVYRDADRISFGKKVHIKAFIRDREYELIKDRKGRIDLLVEGDCGDTVELDFVPKKRQRVHQATFDLGELEPTSAAARGRRLAPKPVARVRRVRTDGAAGEPTEPEEPTDDDQPRLFEEE